MMQFNTIDAQSVTDCTVNAILKKILSGELKSGDKLPPERDLAAQLGISRSSLHQAITSLEVRGFVKIVPRKGTVVCDYRKNQTPQTLEAVMSYGDDDLDYALFEDMMSLRRLLELECARLACDNIYPATQKELEELIKEMKACKGNPSDIVYRFHYLLVKASGNGVYSMIYRGFEPILKRLISKHFEVNASDAEESLKLHSLLVMAIRDKRYDDAVKINTKILDMGVKVLKQSYE